MSPPWATTKRAHATIAYNRIKTQSILFLRTSKLKYKLQNSCDITIVQKKRRKVIKNNTLILLSTKT